MLYKFITASFSVNREKPLKSGTNHARLKSNISYMPGLNNDKRIKGKSIAFFYGRLFQQQQLRLTNQRKEKSYHFQQVEGRFDHTRF